jgi:predicted metallo-beta-lactamase superfamily hydrolase
MTTVECDRENFLFASDVQGPMSTGTLEQILGEEHDLLMIGGPPLYLAGLKVDQAQSEKGLSSLRRIAERVPHVILEHHLLRDENWREKTADVFYSAYKSGHTLQTAAEFLNTKNAFLEASRKRLFEQDPPPKDFEAWRRLTEDSKKHTKPPI